MFVKTTNKGRLKHMLESLLLAIILCGSPGEPAPHPPKWLVHVVDGKGQDCELNYVPMDSLDEYFDNLKAICYWNVSLKRDESTPEEREPFLRKNLTVTNIGSWGPYEVLDITIPEIRHKGIVLKDKSSKYWVLYAQFKWVAADFKGMPQILQVQEQSVLGYRSRVEGTGNFYIEKYFYYDKERKKPVLIDLNVIGDAIKAAVPKGWGVFRGGGLDFPNMKYTSFVHMEDDSYHHPSGGTIDITLSLDKGKLKVVRVDYDKDRPAPY